MKFEAPLQLAADHPAYAGHFPNFPVCPGAVLLDEMLLCLQADRGIVPTEWRIAGAKFIDGVRPGESPVVEFEGADPTSIRFTIRVGARTVVTGTLSRVSSGAPT